MMNLQIMMNCLFFLIKKASTDQFHGKYLVSSILLNWKLLENYLMN